MLSVCVFCGSSAGNRPEYPTLARSVGTLLARQGMTVVYGGARVGMMGALADAALAEGGRVIGVIPRMLLDREVAHQGLTELHVVSTMSERKVMMGELSQAFLALPGGIGTMDELFEAWTWTQLGLQDKPCGLLNHEGFYDSLLAFLNHAGAQGFLRPRHRAALLVGTDVEDLIRRLVEAAGPREAGLDSPDVSPQPCGPFLLR